MPKGIPKTREQPAPGGAVREPIKDMLAPGGEKDFVESLPEQTSSEDILQSPAEQAPRRKRRTKEEIAAARGEGTPVVVDKRLERAQGKMVGLGAASLIDTGFKVAGKPLNEEEKLDLDDQFYLIAKKSGANADNWIFIILYTVGLIGRLIVSRTDLGEQIKKLFLPQEEKEEAKVEEKK